MAEKSYEVIPVTYPSAGIEIRALLFRPRKLSGLAPAIVYHPSHRSPAMQYEWYVGKFAEAGYVGLAIEQRGYGSGPHGENDRGGPLQQGDMSAGITFLAEQNFVDPARIGVSGHANGAALALIVSAKDSRVRACVSLAPKTDWVRALQAAKQWKPEFYGLTINEMNKGVPPDVDPKPYVERSPITYAEKIRVPVLFVVGAQDWLNPSYHCQWMAEELAKYGNKHTKVHIIDEVDHFYCRRHFLGYQFDEVTRPAVAWFDEYVKGTPSAVKTAASF